MWWTLFWVFSKTQGWNLTDGMLSGSNERKFAYVAILSSVFRDIFASTWKSLNVIQFKF